MFDFSFASVGDILSLSEELFLFLALKLVRYLPEPLVRVLGQTTVGTANSQTRRSA
jgi:hypothetical protein